MAVYVDKMEAKFRGMVMCHMLADTVEELHGMADRLGLKRAWFQAKSFPHYDLSKSKKAEAIRHGAIEINSRQVVELMRRCR